MTSSEIVDGGFYLERIASKVGTGDTTKDAVMENIWQAKLLDNGKIKMTLLDNLHRITGYSEVVDEKEFAQRFVYQPNFVPQEKDPKAEQAEKVTARAERHLANQEYLSAEFEFSNALKLDDRNVRANYGLGKTYLATGEVDKAKESFKKLVEIDEVLDPQYKHIFNDLGIQLRKQGMYAEAVRHYQRALNIGQDDEHLWFNLGRALFEWGQAAKAVECLQKALKLNPELIEAKAILHAAQKKMQQAGK